MGLKHEAHPPDSILVPVKETAYALTVSGRIRNTRALMMLS